jgi:hypothetical protein
MGIKLRLLNILSAHFALNTSDLAKKCKGRSIRQAIIMASKNELGCVAAIMQAPVFGILFNPIPFISR